MGSRSRCHSCGTEVKASHRRCPRCYVALRGATRGPDPLRTAPSAPSIDGQLALAAPRLSEQPRSASVRCRSCETTVASSTGRCSYCGEPLSPESVTSEIAVADEWDFESLDDWVEDGPDAQIIVGPWLASPASNRPDAAVDEVYPDDDADLDRDSYLHDGSFTTAEDEYLDDGQYAGEDTFVVADDWTGVAQAAAAPAEEMGAGAMASRHPSDVEELEETEPQAMPPGPTAAGATVVQLVHAGAPATTATNVEHLVAAASCASWRQRALAGLIDVAVFVPALLALVFSVTIGAMLLVDACAFTLWQSWFLQGRSGQTIGKNRLGIYLVARDDLGVLGPRRALLRELGHIFDVLLFFSGDHRAYRTTDRQTVADRIFDTVVVSEPPAFTISGRGQIIRRK